jgi:hypothetical protein
VATNVPGGDAVQAVVAKLSAPLLELWAQFWPFGKKVPYLSVLSGDVPMAVLDTFPLDRPETISAIFESVVRERQAIVEGRNERFEQLVTELAPLGIPREKLVELTNFPLLPAYRWAIDRSDQIEAVRPAATKLERQLQVVRRRLVAASPQLTAVIVDRLDLLLRYLDGIPTKGSLRQWRRGLGLNRRSGGLWKLTAWTPIASDLVQYLRERSGRHAGTFAERTAHALLRARYPDVVDPDWRKLANRVNRKPSLLGRSG